MNSIRTLAAVAAVALLGGCVSAGRNYDTGSVTHRMIAPDGSVAHLYYPDEEASALDVVQPGDSVSVRLLAIYVCDFFEQNAFPEFAWLAIREAFMDPGTGEYPPEPCSRAGLAASKHYTRGEIVVLADVFEQGAGRPLAFDRDSTQPSSARVIYYDDDVRESGQYLSLANLPVYGPITYNGNALFLRLYMLELDDEENAQMGAMLGKLAELGGKAYPPASAVLQTLSNVGGALLSGEQDDLEFRYTMAFDPYDGVSTSRLPLAVGTYVILKQGNRSVDFGWGKRAFDRHAGALANPDGSRIRTDTYMVIKVTRNEPAQEQDSFQVYSEFQATPTSGTVALESLTSSAEAMGTRLERAVLFDRLRSSATLLSDPKASGTVAAAQADVAVRGALCAVATKEESGTVLDQEQAHYLLGSLAPHCIRTPARGTLEHWQTACHAGEPLCG